MRGEGKGEGRGGGEGEIKPLPTSSFSGTLVMASSQSDDKDSLWMVDSDVFPFQNTLMESHVRNLPRLCNPQTILTRCVPRLLAQRVKT